MRGSIKTIRVVAITVVLAGFFSPANAYVLSAPHILELMTQKLGSARSLLVSQKLTLYDHSMNPNGAMNPNGIEFKEILRYFFPSRFRSDISSQMTRRIHLISHGRVLTVIDGKVASNVESRYDRYKDIFFYRLRKQLVERLAFLGIDTTISSLGRFQGKIAFVVGALYPDETVSQIWVDKESFTPLRWIDIARTADGREDALEVQFDRWQQVNGVWYPGHIEFYQQRRLIRKIDVQNVQTNVSFSGDLFNVVRLQSTVSPKESSPPQGSGQEKANEVQKAIEEFKKTFD